MLRLETREMPASDHPNCYSTGHGERTGRCDSNLWRVIEEAGRSRHREEPPRFEMQLWPRHIPTKERLEPGEMARRNLQTVRRLLCTEPKAEQLFAIRREPKQFLDRSAEKDVVATLADATHEVLAFADVRVHALRSPILLYQAAWAKQTKLVTGLVKLLMSPSLSPHLGATLGAPPLCPSLLSKSESPNVKIRKAD